MTAPHALAMYQGADFTQRLSFFADEAQTVPLVFTDPVMDVRAGRTLYATFDTTGAGGGLFTITSPGVLDMTMPWRETEKIRATTFELDIFADVNGARVPITKRGVLQLVVTGRITQDEKP